MHAGDGMTPQPLQQHGLQGQQQQRVVTLKGALLALLCMLLCLFVEEINEIRIEAKRLMGASVLRTTPEDANTYRSLREHQMIAQKRHDMAEATAERIGVDSHRVDTQSVEHGTVGDVAIAEGLTSFNPVDKVFSLARADAEAPAATADVPADLEDDARAPPKKRPGDMDGDRDGSAPVFDVVVPKLDNKEKSKVTNERVDDATDSSTEMADNSKQTFLGFTAYERSAMMDPNFTAALGIRPDDDAFRDWLENWQCLPDDKHGYEGSDFNDQCRAAAGGKTPVEGDLLPAWASRDPLAGHGWAVCLSTHTSYLYAQLKE